MTSTPLNHSDAGEERIHVVLVGFMGSGKTTVGRLLALRIGWKFIDLDDVIVESAGASIRDIYRHHGEVGFRARERAALRDILASSAPVVLSTGGATFVDPLMRERIQQSSRTVYLQATPEVLLTRIDAGERRRQRPLVSGPDPQQTIRRQLESYCAAYEQCEHMVRTDLARADQVVEELTRLLRVPKTSTRSRKRAPGGFSRAAPALGVFSQSSRGQRYEIHCRAEAGAWLADAIVEACPGPQIALLSDDTVAELHGSSLASDLRERGKSVSLHTVSPGENSKTLSSAGLLVDRLSQEGMDAGDAIVALGGGMVCDLAGFVASIFLCGIPYVQVPTTTVAALQASTGGRTKLNTPGGANRVGTLYPPRAVLISIAHLATQDRRVHAAGLVEALKLAATLDAAFFDALMHDAGKLLAFEPEPLLVAIRRTVALKAEVVARHELEAGEPAVLSFGHTIGAAIDEGEAGKLLCGEALGLGMLAESEWAKAEGLASEVSDQLHAALRALGMPVDWRSASIAIEALGLERTRRSSTVRMAYLPKLGSFQIRELPLAVLVDFVRRGVS